MKSLLIKLITTAVVFSCSELATASTYNLEIFVNLTPGNLNEAQFGQEMAAEGLDIGPDGKMYATRFSHGTIYRIEYAEGEQQNIEEFARFPDRPNLNLTGIKVDRFGNVYVAVHDTDAAGDPTEFNGVWKIGKQGGDCNLSPSGSDPSNPPPPKSPHCKKVFPRHGENISFPDGLAVDARGRVYVSDPDRGTIWKFDSRQLGVPGVLWAGTLNVSDPILPNEVNELMGIHLRGIPILGVLGLNRFGLGFGVNGIDLDRYGDNLYAVNGESGYLLRIPIDREDGSSGEIEVIADGGGFLLFDGTHFDLNANRVYVTVSGELGGPLGLMAGSKIMVADIVAGQDPTLIPIIDDPLAGAASDVHTDAGFGGSADDLYIIDLSQGFSPSGPNIIRAKLVE